MPSDSRTHRIPFAAAFTLAAGVIHFAVAGPHFGDSVTLGVGFVLVGWAQLAAGALAVARRPGAGWLIAAVNVIAIVAWGVSRTVGLPIGHPGPEQVGVDDLTTVGLEAAAIGLLLWRSTASGERRWTRAATATGLAWTLSVCGSAVAIANIEGHGHGGHASTSSGEAPVDDQHPHGDHEQAAEPGSDGRDTSSPNSSPNDTLPTSLSEAPTDAEEPTPKPSQPESDDHTHAPDEGH